MQAEVSKSIGSAVARIRAHSTLPVAVGFGISNADQARQVAADAEAIVVGSAVVTRIAALGRSAALVPEVAAFVQTLSDAIHPKP
jgi:tryptophan synthase alpha chain